MLRVCEVAAKLGIKECTVRLWLSQRKLTHVKLGRSVRVTEEELKRFVEEHVIPRRRA